MIMFLGLAPLRTAITCACCMMDFYQDTSLDLNNYT